MVDEHLTRVSDERRPDAEHWQTAWRLPVILSLCCFGLGVTFLLLLNGQVFTNAVVFVSLCIVSCLLWGSVGWRSRQAAELRVVRYVVLGHVAVILAVGLTLRERHAWQTRFNARVGQIHSAAQFNP